MQADEESKTLFKIRSVSDFIHHAHNERFRIQEALQFCSDEFASQATSIHGDTPAPDQPSQTYLRFTVDHDMIDEQAGFVFGSDRAACDVLIDTPSPRLFAIRFKPATKAVLLKNLSTDGIHVSSTQYTTTKIKSQRALVPNDKVTIYLPRTDLTLDLAAPSQDLLQRYHMEQFWARLARALPGLGGLELESIPPSTAPPASQKTRRTYIMQSKVGSGAFGTVHRALHTYTGEVVAVKEFHNAQKFSLREPAILESLSHPNIVKFIEFISGQGHPLLVMEFVSGSSLGTEHEQSPLIRQEIRDLTCELLDGLAYLHSKHVTHRDLKPDNILVTCRSPVRIKLTDFGLSALRSQNLTTWCGTRLYLAPEVDERRPYTNKVDLWSLGVVVLELFSGLPSYSQRHRQQWPGLLRERLDRANRLESHYEFVKSLLQVDPRDRPSAVQSLALARSLQDAWDATQYAASSSTIPLPASLLSRSENAPGPSSLQTAAQTQIFVPLSTSLLSRPENAPGPSSQQIAAQTQIFAPLLSWIDDVEHVEDQCSPGQIAAAPPVSDGGESSNMAQPVAHASVPKSDAVTPTEAYWILRLGNRTVAYMAREGLVNITHVAHASGYGSQLPWKSIDKDLGKIDRTMVRGKDLQGSYVTFADAGKDR